MRSLSTAALRGRLVALASSSPLLTMRLANVAMQFVISIMTVRLLGLETAGAVFLVQAIWILGRTVGSWGYYWIVLRERGVAQGGVRAVWRAAVSRVTMINLAVAAVAVGVKLAAPGDRFVDWPLFLLSLGGFGVMGVSALTMAALLALRRPIRATSLEMIGLPLVQAIPIAGFALFAPHADASIIVGCQLALLAAALVALSASLTRACAGRANYRLPRARQAWLLWVSDCSTNVALRLPLFVTQAFAGFAAGAVVAVVQQLGLLGSVFNWAAITQSQPKLVRAFKSGSTVLVRQTMLQNVPLAFSMNLFFIAALWLVGFPLIELVYKIAGASVRVGITILALMALIDAIFGIGVSALNVSHRERLSAGLSIAMAVATAALGWMFLARGWDAAVAVPSALLLCWTIRGAACWGLAFVRAPDGLR